MKEDVLTGNGISQLRTMISRIGYNDSYTLEMGKVVTPLPNLTIKLEGNDVVIPRSFLFALQSAVDADLKANDPILVGTMDEGQTFIILDKVVSF